MRKRLITPSPQDAPPLDEVWLDQEDPHHSSLCCRNAVSTPDAHTSVSPCAATPVTVFENATAHSTRPQASITCTSFPHHSTTSSPSNVRARGQSSTSAALTYSSAYSKAFSNINSTLLCIHLGIPPN